MYQNQVHVNTPCGSIHHWHASKEPCKVREAERIPIHVCLYVCLIVYHVLSKSQIAAWDQAISDHNNGELTDKGLSKRRSAVLLEAGLYYNFTKDDEYLEKTKEQSTKSRYQCMYMMVHYISLSYIQVILLSVLPSHQ